MGIKWGALGRRTKRQLTLGRLRPSRPGENLPRGRSVINWQSWFLNFLVAPGHDRGEVALAYNKDSLEILELPVVLQA
jgi:hypothetical protein